VREGDEALLLEIAPLVARSFDVYIRPQLEGI
jgi:hypothetical protein